MYIRRMEPTGPEPLLSRTSSPLSSDTPRIATLSFLAPNGVVKLMPTVRLRVSIEGATITKMLQRGHHLNRTREGSGHGEQITPNID